MRGGMIMRGGTLLILGLRVEGQGQIWHSVYEILWAQYRLKFCPITLNFHM